ncbi:hypothetical protein QS713_02210 [Gleimia hominis]|uniref:Beta-galactosidase subunit beta n=1 Tax=Gleimia hominis TaxID=595468 RepID=A0ABU3I9K5_9ACTO|nr:hypothetical protein [Gleimia hominis]MDT3766878.1 hypothetical protein [Gleimia hominis]
MKIFNSITLFREIMGAHRKWQRAQEAILSPERRPDITFSIGDSLTWRVVDHNNHESCLIGSRRYQRVIYCEKGLIKLEYAKQLSLEPTNEYSDLSDTQEYAGPTTTITLSDGMIAIVGIDEAARIVPGSNFKGITLRVTVEGHTFHNK